MKQAKIKHQHHGEIQHHLHIKLPKGMVEKMMINRQLTGVTMRTQVIQALETSGVGVEMRFKKGKASDLTTAIVEFLAYLF